MYSELLIESIDGVEYQHIQRANGDGSFTCFPADPENTHYSSYLAWLAEGNEPLPADDPS